MGKNIYDRVAGSLLAGAAGDALGFEVEFMSLKRIRELYHNSTGITEFALHGGRALISDDTQMTVATAAALLAAKEKAEMTDKIRLFYVDWSKLQTGRNDLNELPTKYRIAAMSERRAPGLTCMSALQNIEKGYPVENNSKGCGGIMRIAPIALYGAAGGTLDCGEVMRLAYESSYLTHHHRLGCLPSAFAAGLIYRLTLTETPTAESFKQCVAAALDDTESIFGEDRNMAYLRRLTERAVGLAESETDDSRSIALLGEGWVAEETAAIAVFCALRHFGDMEKALIASVNHDGDSDSTGAVCGNILGAACGLKSIPQKFLDNLEMKEVLLEIARNISK